MGAARLSIYRKARMVSQRKRREEDKEKLKEKLKERRERLKRWENKFLKLPTAVSVNSLNHEGIKDENKTIFCAIEVGLVKLESVYSVVFIYTDGSAEIFFSRIEFLSDESKNDIELWIDTIEEHLRINISFLFPEKTGKKSENVPIPFEGKGEDNIKQLFDELSGYLSKTSQ